MPQLTTSPHERRRSLAYNHQRPPEIFQLVFSSSYLHQFRNSFRIVCPFESMKSRIKNLLRVRSPSPRKSSRKRDYSALIDTADSIVDFVLKGVQNVGSGLPGIGIVSVVLAAKDKFMVSSFRVLDRIFLMSWCRPTVKIERRWINFWSTSRTFARTLMLQEESVCR